MMTGTIQGGYEFLVAGYALTWFVLGGYALSLYRRYRSIR